MQVGDRIPLGLLASLVVDIEHLTVGAILAHGFLDRPVAGKRAFDAFGGEVGASGGTSCDVGGGFRELLGPVKGIVLGVVIIRIMWDLLANVFFFVVSSVFGACLAFLSFHVE